jgi:hypothetical protein
MKVNLKKKTKWESAAMELLKQVARTNPYFTADDVRELADSQQGFAKPYTHSAWGVLFRAAAKQKLIKKTRRYKPSTRQSGYVRIINIWESLLIN